LQNRDGVILPDPSTTSLVRASGYNDQEGTLSPYNLDATANADLIKETKSKKEKFREDGNKQREKH
jgi:hypothetical protein